MVSHFESDLPTLHKLCWLINEQWKAELAYSRAQYRVSYYRKLKAKLESSKKTSEKWNDHIELSKKIESTRLISLKKQKDLMELKKRLRGPISTAVKKLKALLLQKEGHTCAISFVKNSKEINATQIAEMADQYEAEKALTKVLTTKGNE